MSKIKIACPCIFGLESVLSAEVKKLGVQNIEVTDGKVTFVGDLIDVAKANIWLRTAERVQIVMGSFRAETFEELFQGVLALDFENFIRKEDAFPVKGWSLNSKLHSVPDCQSIVKKAIVRRLENKYNQSWFEETGSRVQVQFSILKDIVTVLLDTSGAGLHKRGYRQKSNIAPIKETLAAGIVDLARIHNDSVILDPFCGSGTLLIEAALYALNIAPGINRRFAAEKWGVFSEDNIFKSVRLEALEAIDRQAEFRGYGYDVDPAAVELTQENARIAGVANRFQIAQQDIADFKTDELRATIITNPPYGERMLDVKDAQKLYKTMGEVFERRKFLNYYIISPDEQFEEMFGSGADRRRKLYNGMIKCQLYMYFKGLPEKRV
ncbi:putative N6-adenine-specific DNA methylase [Hydrogenoanaerobacterium saccharovorans]|uniref:Putative N6-adenine-specific DNA methylase n=1 Tax=Hydrogenoanaerobacterium saccharovorans TaxID=474960 RepID=A0A1H7ZWB1_9FIRM|nr:class I SAM-dependent RNA methyltransferase [Hydrogenoanaerobacterium saccharovorans]RPF48346.1 putative N6-adenine-specific DNA methylase [Hydrogenoanaerobacterium saccharovorans]SEM62516.1 putative N6-adenine-specific DNA methylase [Hydrogenoanaerobacterium saccharovorans]